MRFALLLAIIGGASSLLPPRLANGQDKAPPEPSVQRLYALLGKTATSDEVNAFRKSMKEAPTEDVIIARDWFYYSWKEHGLSLRFGKGKVVSIFLYADGVDGYKQFRGELPKKLALSGTRADVERKLGEYDQVSNDTGHVSTTYEGIGVRVDYVSKDLNDKGNRVRTIMLFPPKKDRK